MSLPDRRIRAFTLLEVLVASVILALLFGLVSAYLIPAMRLGMRSAAQSEMQQQAIVTLNRLSQDLQLTPVNGFTLRTTGDPQGNLGMLLIPIQAVSGGGVVTYSPNVVAYSWSSAAQRVTRCIFPIPAAYHPTPSGIGFPPSLSSTDVTLMVDTLSSAQTLMATGVQSFSISQYGPRDDLIRAPITLDMVLVRSGSFSPIPLTFEIRRSYSFRNAPPATEPTPVP